MYLWFTVSFLINGRHVVHDLLSLYPEQIFLSSWVDQLCELEAQEELPIASLSMTVCWEMLASPEILCSHEHLVTYCSLHLLSAIRLAYDVSVHLVLFIGAGRKSTDHGYNPVIELCSHERGPLV